MAASIITDAQKENDGLCEGEKSATRLGESTEDKSSWFEEEKYADAANSYAKEGEGGEQDFAQGPSERAMRQGGARSAVGTGLRIALATLGLLLALWLAVQLRSILVLLLIALVLATGI